MVALFPSVDRDKLFSLVLNTFFINLKEFLRYKHYIRNFGNPCSCMYVCACD